MVREERWRNWTGVFSISGLDPQMHEHRPFGGHHVADSGGQVFQILEGEGGGVAGGLGHAFPVGPP